ncbi:hypothetical protein KCTC52924_03711 [Arenibacter antarcticus]|uniref:YegP family protein n=1 Tax=Arenibacter antarcticus TaxID=2040469 RepID=A0ABW5VFX9_9FLAO|nr:YegP family protein [Arenibacter sp. H213]MCM4168155.1 hypothetical protein [Arenibacter sp. H213]
MIRIKQELDHTFSFTLQSESGHNLLQSVPFSDKQKLEWTIATLKELILRHSSFERKTNYNGKFFFLLKDSDGKLIGNSMFYSSEAGMENGIKNIKTSITLLPDTIDL